MSRRRAIARDERGQVSVEFMGMLPFLVLAAMLAWQLLLVGYAATSAENAARAASRVEARGGDGRKAAKRVVDSPLRKGIQTNIEGTKAVVRVRVPLLMPGIGDDRIVVSRDAELPN